MIRSNVYTAAKVVSADALNSNEEATNQASNKIQEFQLGNFVVTQAATSSNAETPQPVKNSNIILNDSNINGNVDPTLLEVKKISQQLNTINQRIENLENNGVGQKEIDKQVVKAIQDLKQYANFFEQAIFQLESKILRTSLSIAQKVIQIEVGENSSAIAKETINSLLDKIKNASKVTIHLNPKDYAILNGDLELKPYIELQEDANVTPGGVVIASDLGNFDGSIEAKINSLVESLEMLI